ncbi:MAG: TMEM165/GDT1 family protein [Chloroflexi bacterium]|nr:TMEM165/GDT1 family protein [Chloroflexota bacterium]MCL5950068.1 TMEM165/GDT1 family protein [Candidatus Bathyarchaeota archaeon]
MFELSFAAFAASLVFVVLAEMGDKTQLLAMSFATRFNPYKVLLAVFIATIANHALAVVAGQFLTTIVPMDIISLAASLSFIGFGLWTIRGDQLKDEAKKASRYGAVATVAIAFFIAEFGDKTQLATISLAAEYQNPISVLIGTTIGMLVADGIGIVVGVVLCKRIPQRKIKWFSALIFVLFGLMGVYEVLMLKVGLGYTALVLAVLAALSAYAMYAISKRQNPVEDPQICKKTA